MPGGKERGNVARALACDDIMRDLSERGWATIPLDRVTNDAYTRLVEHANWFFDEPEERKRELDIASSTGHRGWVSPDQAGDYQDEGPRRYEAFDIGRSAQHDDGVEHPLRGQNRWPEGEQGASMQTDAESMFRYLSQLSERIGDAICADLGVSADRLRQLRTEPVSQLRLIRYFDVEEAASNREDRAAMGAHTPTTSSSRSCSRKSQALRCWTSTATGSMCRTGALPRCWRATCSRCLAAAGTNPYCTAPARV